MIIGCALKNMSARKPLRQRNNDSPHPRYGGRGERYKQDPLPSAGVVLWHFEHERAERHPKYQFLCAGANFRAPFVKAMLDSVQNIRQNDTGDRKYQHTNKYLIGLERRSRNRDHETDPGSCGIKLADQHTNQSSSHGDTEAGQKERQRGREHDALKHLPL